MAAIMCNVCGKRRGKTGNKGTETSPHADMCNYCFEEGGYENQHSDSNHAGIAAEVEGKAGFTTDLSPVDKAEWEEFMPTCWICHPELNLARKPKSITKHSSVEGYTRRPQFNHKSHSHPQTPAARRACKLAFWASLTPVQNVSTDPQVAAAMAAWDYQCDGHGKPLAAKPAAWHVAPLGPKGGVGHSLKVAASKSSQGKVEKELAEAAGLLPKKTSKKGMFTPKGLGIVP